jgi:Tol biopolymer transport system component
VRDLATGTTTLVSRGVAGHAANGPSSYPIFNPDGTNVVFSSTATDLGPPKRSSDVPSGVDAVSSLYSRNLATGAIEALTVNAAGDDTGNKNSYVYGFTSNGRYFLFGSGATDLGALDRNDADDLFVRDLGRGVTTLVSAGSAGAAANGMSWAGTISPDGRKAAFISAATDFGPTDTNGKSDIYVATLHGADLHLDGRATPEPVTTGASISVTLHLDNNGPDAATDTNVGIFLPSGVIYTGAVSTSGSCAAPTASHPDLVLCTVGDMATTDHVDITMTATVTAPASTTLHTKALATSSAPDPATPDNLTDIPSTVGL